MGAFFVYILFGSFKVLPILAVAPSTPVATLRIIGSPLADVTVVAPTLDVAASPGPRRMNPY